MCVVCELEVTGLRLESLEAENARLKAQIAEQEGHLLHGLACVAGLMDELNRLRGRKALDPADKAAILAAVRESILLGAAPAVEGGE